MTRPHAKKNKNTPLFHIVGHAMTWNYTYYSQDVDQGTYSFSYTGHDNVSTDTQKPQGLANPPSLAGPQPWMRAALKLSPLENSGGQREDHISGLLIIPTDGWAHTTGRSLGESPHNVLMSHHHAGTGFRPVCRTFGTPSHVRLDKWQFFRERQLEGVRAVGVRGRVGGLVLQLSHWPCPPPGQRSH